MFSYAEIRERGGRLGDLAIAEPAAMA